APSMNTEPSASRLSGATFVALFVAALAIWFVIRVVEVLLLVFIAVLCAVYLSAITDVLERRFRLARSLGLTAAVLATPAAVVGIGARLARLCRAGILSLVSPKHRPVAARILDDLGATLRAWVVGQLLAMMVLAVLAALGLWVLGVPYWLAFGIFTGLVAVVPFFGTLVSTLLPALFVVGTGDWLRVLAVIVLGVAVHVVEAHVVVPRIMQRQVSLPPVLTIASVLTIGTLIGVVGLVVAVPVLAVTLEPVRGGLPAEGRGWLPTAIERGLELSGGLHTFIGDDPGLGALARGRGVRICDARKPPANLPVADGLAAEVDASVVHTVGSDGNVGKMTAQVELRNALLKRGHRTRFVATGQTGIFIEGWGIAVDAVVADFIAGA